MSLVACSKVPRWWTITLHALLQYALTESRYCWYRPYRKLITTCIFVLLSVVSSMIGPRIHTEEDLHDHWRRLVTNIGWANQNMGEILGSLRCEYRLSSCLASVYSRGVL